MENEEPSMNESTHIIHFPLRVFQRPAFFAGSIINYF